MTHDKSGGGRVSIKELNHVLVSRYFATVADDCLMFAVMSPGQNTTCRIELHTLPCIRYMSVLFGFDSAMVEGCEHYQKGSYRNRYHIAGPQGIQRLSIPLQKGKHQQQPIQEVMIAYHTPWYRQHLRAIQTGYGSAPYFMHYYPELEDILYRKESSLWKLNIMLLEWVKSIVEFPFQMAITEDFQLPGNATDLLNTIQPHDQFNNTSYQQVFTDRHGFIENLSILDLIMHLGPESSRYLAAENQRLTIRP